MLPASWWGLAALAIVLTGRPCEGLQTLHITTSSPFPSSCSLGTSPLAEVPGLARGRAAVHTPPS